MAFVRCCPTLRNSWVATQPSQRVLNFLAANARLNKKRMIVQGAIAGGETRDEKVKQVSMLRQNKVDPEDANFNKNKEMRHVVTGSDTSENDLISNMEVQMNENNNAMDTSKDDEVKTATENVSALEELGDAKSLLKEDRTYLNVPTAKAVDYGDDKVLENAIRELKQKLDQQKLELEDYSVKAKEMAKELEENTATCLQALMEKMKADLEQVRMVPQAVEERLDEFHEELDLNNKLKTVVDKISKIDAKVDEKITKCLDDCAEIEDEKATMYFNGCVDQCAQLIQGESESIQKTLVIKLEKVMEKIEYNLAVRLCDEARDYDEYERFLKSGHEQGQKKKRKPR